MKMNFSFTKRYEILIKNFINFLLFVIQFFSFIMFRGRKCNMTLALKDFQIFQSIFLHVQVYETTHRPLLQWRIMQLNTLIKLVVIQNDSAKSIFDATQSYTIIKSLRCQMITLITKTYNLLQRQECDLDETNLSN